MLISVFSYSSHFFFFNDTATTEIYTLSLHDALPIYIARVAPKILGPGIVPSSMACLISISPYPAPSVSTRSEEHTSELQSPCNLVCRLLLEKKKLPHVYRRHYNRCDLHVLDALLTCM